MISLRSFLDAVLGDFEWIRERFEQLDLEPLDNISALSRDIACFSGIEKDKLFLLSFALTMTTQRIPDWKKVEEKDLIFRTGEINTLVDSVLKGLEKARDALIEEDNEKFFDGIVDIYHPAAEFNFRTNLLHRRKTAEDKKKEELAKEILSKAIKEKLAGESLGE